LLQENKQGLKFQIPLFYMGGQFLAAEERLYENLRDFISRQLNAAPVPGAHPADLREHFQDFVPAAVVLAGLADGINPCAFTVIVFFMSFLALQGYRKREIFLIGSAFILAVFLTYLGLGLGIFNFFYRFRGFWLIGRLFNWAVGIFCIVLGIFAIYDLILYRKSGSTDGMLLQLPKPVKESIHRVVGFFYRRSPREKKENVKPHLFKLVASAFLTGFLVSLLEAVCTGQVYLPTITFVLKTTELKMQAWGYLLLYNIMFVLPLAGVFALALLGTSSQQFAFFLKKRLGLIKIFMAVLFFSMGAYLLWRG
jgi:cytochrome c biogenesis protein CcdA